MRPEHVLEAKRWLKQARRDLEDARYCHEGGRYNIACFLAQQAAEKALKAYLYSEGEDPWGHSVAELVARCKEINEAFSRLASEAATLDKYYIPTRYPNGLPGGIPAEAFDIHDGERALQVAEQVIERVQQLGLAKAGQFKPSAVHDGALQRSRCPFSNKRDRDVAVGCGGGI